MATRRGTRAARDKPKRFAELLAEVRDEVARQGRQVGRLQWRAVHLHDVQAKEEILPKFGPRAHALQVSLRHGNDTKSTLTVRLPPTRSSSRAARRHQSRRGTVYRH